MAKWGRYNTTLRYHDAVSCSTSPPQSAPRRSFSRVGRLHNARAKLCTLCQVFDVDPKTLRRWGLALKSSPAEMVRILEGRFAARKCTVEIESFIRVRWPDLLATRSDGAVKRLQAEIKAVFGDEVYEQVIADPYLPLITWEKGYIAGPWDPQLVTGKTVITRYRNSSKDLHNCPFEDFAW